MSNREHELSRDCWCQPTVDGNAPDGISLDEQIKHQQSIYNSDLDTFGIKSEWAIKSGSILASLLELRDRRVVDDAKPTSERLGTALARAFALSWLKYEDYLRVKSYLPINALIVEQSQSTENAEGRVPCRTPVSSPGPAMSKPDSTNDVSPVSAVSLDESAPATQPAPSAPDAGQVVVPDYKAMWLDLIMQVGNAYPGESRHETAKRYIIERENRPLSGPHSAAGSRHE